MLTICVLLLPLSMVARAESLEDISRDFWSWRALTQPLSSDDVPRIERPQGWAPEWSRSSLASQQQSLERFELRWKRIDVSHMPVSRQVDYRLIGAALARVRWELVCTRNFERNPYFYVDQTIGAVFDRLLRPAPFDRTRSSEVIRALASIPETVQAAKINLERSAVRAFAIMAIQELKDVRRRLLTVARELKPLLDNDSAQRIDTVTGEAIAALESLRGWLERRLPSMSTNTSVGRLAYLFFLRNVALLPFTPEQLLAMGRQEWDRAAAFQSLELHRNAGLPKLSLFADIIGEIAREAKDEVAVREFRESKDLLTIPPWVKHYHYLPVPGYLDPLISLGVPDDLTSPQRLNENAFIYVKPPASDLGYFDLTRSLDPRALLVHEGIPGHFLQLVLAWEQDDEIRRHYYDSSANEGIGFYAEEMMLQGGFFDDSPRSREIIYSFMKLRALRLEVDVKLALGLFDIDQAAACLEKAVPMDRFTARQEASFFASAPGQAVGYQAGKLQITSFLADSQRIKGSGFSLRAFHDFLYRNGNVPITLQRWEYLGLTDEMATLDRSTRQ
jgi:hypothetical protein